MRDRLIQAIGSAPFVPFVLRLEGGFEVRVGHPENSVFIPGLLFVTVFETRRIVSLRRAGEPA